MHKYVYWYCPNCGKMINCFWAEQEFDFKCYKCSTELKPTAINCIEGYVTCSPRWYYDYRLVCELYLKKELSAEALAKIEEDISPADEEKLANSHLVQWEMKYYQPKIDAWKIMIESGQDIEFNLKEETDKADKLYDIAYKQYREDYDRQLDIQLQAQRPKCPTCGSTNIKKISDLERGVSVGMWGLFSSKIGKTMKCNSCGHKW